MEPVNSLERLSELLRKKVTEKNYGARTSKVAPDSQAQSSGRSSLAVFEQQMQQKIKNLQQIKAAPSALQHTVIESILAWEFGESLRNEPKFVALVNRVKQHVEEESEVKIALEKLYKNLVR
jgi:hypothetical protein